MQSLTGWNRWVWSSWSLTDATSIFYLTGIWVDAGERLVALYLSRHRDCCFFVNNSSTCRRTRELRLCVSPTRIRILRMLAGCTDSTRPLGWTKILPARFLLPLMSMGCGAEYVNASICVDETRAFKDEEECQAMRLASAINDKAMERFKAL